MVVLTLAAVLAWQRRQWGGLGMAVLAGFAVTATAVMFLDGKNWFYHRIPASMNSSMSPSRTVAGLLFSTLVRRSFTIW